jgi:hypothetical protein
MTTLKGKSAVFDEGPGGPCHAFLECHPGKQSTKKVFSETARRMLLAERHFQHEGEDNRVQDELNQGVQNRPEDANHRSDVTASDVPGHELTNEILVVQKSA